VASLTDDQWEELVQFYQEGHTYKECGVRFGISKTTVSRHFTKHPEIPRRKPLTKVKEKRLDNLGRVRVEEITPPGPAKPRKIVSLKEEWKEA
jgi:DNA invertase Pin-like site-specific DNA recombinase